METLSLFEHDKKFIFPVLGADEVGRGPLAGPVVCAACIMPLKVSSFINKINDSKKLSKKNREELSILIKETALDYCIFEADNNMIDAINILNATRYAMKNAIEGLKKVEPSTILVDAITGLKLAREYHPIIKGDALSYNIAAASILAKVYRDSLMIELAQAYPEYHFETNMGYGTAEHIKALKEYGPCKLHRRSFIKNFIEEKQIKQIEFKL